VTFWRLLDILPVLVLVPVSDFWEENLGSVASASDGSLVIRVMQADQGKKGIEAYTQDENACSKELETRGEKTSGCGSYL
jgi:hypothetical protein